MGGHVARNGVMRDVCEVSVGKPKGKRPLKDLDRGERIILKWILKK
jgi:hypothetical protein